MVLKWFATFLSLLAVSEVVAQGAQECPRDGARLTEASQRTVVISRPELLTSAFSLEKTLGAIIESASPGAATPTEKVVLLNTMIRSFRSTARTNPDSNLSMDVSPRPNEAAMDPALLLSARGEIGSMVPVALFNRFDLAPANWRYCGEHRIVFARKAASFNDRFLLIFEAAVDNPDPAGGPAGCLRIARFWKGLEGETPEKAVQLLEGFYYKGDLNDGGGIIQPVVHFKHYGMPFGQIRSNMFMNSGAGVENPWMLREWRLGIGADGLPVFIPDTVKANPATLLFAGDAATGEEREWRELRQEFQSSFVLNNVRELIDLDLAAKPAAEPRTSRLLSRVGARFQNRFNAFESNPQENSHDPSKAIENSPLRGGIEAELKNYTLPRPLTAKHLVARAGALTCAGCHMLSHPVAPLPQPHQGQEIAPGVAWPASAGFVHVTEKGDLSPALLDHFLPDRCDNLRSQIDLLAKAAPKPQTDQIVVQFRQVLTRLQAPQPPLTRLEGLPALERDVTIVRQQDREMPGASIQFRRSH